MGAVYRAQEARTGQAVAIKVVTAAASETALKRFAIEAEAQARVGEHPNVLRVYESGYWQGTPYLVMDLAPGGDLLGRLERGGLEPLEVAQLGAALAHGLAHVHGLGVMHRDLKPDNVLFDAEGQPLLADFGVARLRGAGRLTGTGQMVGTPSYMSPEQLEGESGGAQIDERTDIYGLGAVLYHALTGRAPFEGSLAEVMKHIALDDPPTPSSLGVKALPLERVILRALSKSPDARYASAGDLAHALETLEPESLALRAGRTISAGAVVGSLVALGVLVAGGFAAHQALKPEASLPDTPSLVVEEGPPPETRERRVTFLLKAGPEIESVEVTREPSKGFKARSYRPRSDRSLEIKRLPLAPGENRFSFLPSSSTGQREALAVVVRQVQSWTASRVTCQVTGSILVRITPPPEGVRLGPGDPPAALYSGLRAEGGQQFDEALEPHRAKLTKPFYLAQTEVTWAQYLKFCQDTKRRLPEREFTFERNDAPGDNKSQQTITFRVEPSDYATTPLFNVTWEEAQAYCEWAGLRLPTETEWVLAARGAEDREFPWGKNAPLGAFPASLNVRDNPVNYHPFAPVGEPREGRTPDYEIANLGGNVAEWLGDWFSMDRKTGPDFRGPLTGTERIVRGGNFQKGFHTALRCFRTAYSVTRRRPNLGFRVARDAEPEE
jgi:serine/threonine protein kinase/formylglycine-generating enzyme required for sulfatase activity